MKFPTAPKSGSLETRQDMRVPRDVLEVVEAKRQVVKANQDSHARRLEAIEAKKRRDEGEEGGGGSKGGFRW